MRAMYLNKVGIMLILLSLFFVSVIIFNGCEKESNTAAEYRAKTIYDISNERTQELEYEPAHRRINVSLDSMSNCLNMGLTADTPDIPFNLDCIEWYHYQDNRLFICHGNAGFNCCPEIDKTIEVRGDSIILTEIEISGDCDCNCLFDIFYSISNLTPGVYHFKVIEPYVRPEDELLEFTIDLTSEPVGSYCVERNYYPWGEQ